MAIIPTFDMGKFRDAHMRDECETGPDGFIVSCPPFTLDGGDETATFLGAVPCEYARALLWRTTRGTRYVTLRFWDDEEGTVYPGYIEGEGDAAIEAAVGAAIEDYRSERSIPKPRAVRA